MAISDKASPLPEDDHLPPADNSESGFPDASKGTLASKSDDLAEKQVSHSNSFYSGNSLNIDEVTRVTSQNQCQVITIAGETESGKTTLLASLYELFNQGQVGNYLFAGSETLPAFEKICLLSRSTSGLDIPDTPRTIQMSEQFLHLQVLKDNSTEEKRHNILFTDISGERFRRIKNSSTEGVKLSLLNRTNHFALLVDGEKLVALDTRQKAFTDAHQLLRSCLDSKILGADTWVQILFSKWDLVERDNSKTVAEFIDYIRGFFIEAFSSRVNNLELMSIASRPATQSLPNGYHLPELFEFWIENNAESPSIPRFRSPTPKYEIDRFRFESEGGR